MSKEIPSIPRFLNVEDKVAFWTWNELILFLLVSFVISISFSILLGLVLGGLGVRFMRQLQRTQFGDLTKIGFYWFSPWSQKRFKSLPPSYIREFIG